MLLNTIGCLSAVSSAQQISQRCAAWIYFKNLSQSRAQSLATSYSLQRALSPQGLVELPNKIDGERYVSIVRKESSVKRLQLQVGKLVLSIIRVDNIWLQCLYWSHVGSRPLSAHLSSKNIGVMEQRQKRWRQGCREMEVDRSESAKWRPSENPQSLMNTLEYLSSRQPGPVAPLMLVQVDCVSSHYDTRACQFAMSSAVSKFWVTLNQAWATVHVAAVSSNVSPASLQSIKWRGSWCERATCL